MADDAASNDLSNIVDMATKRASRYDGGGLSGGGGGGTSDGMELRVAALEKGMEKALARLDDIQKSIDAGRLDVEKRFGSLEKSLVAIEGKLDAKAAATDMREVVGKVSNITTFWQTFFLIFGAIVTTLGSVAGLAFTLLRMAGKAP